MHSSLHSIGILMALGFSVAGCNTVDRLANVGKAPKLAAIQNPQAHAGYRPVEMPMPTPEPVSYAPNSLWQSGARAFFNDQRARRVGDILTVLVTVSDSATISNETARSRASSNDFGASAGGVVNKLINQVTPDLTAGAQIDYESGTSDKGTGSVNRSEQLTTKVAAVIVQVLPNGNMVIEGRQEVRVNFEVRELLIAGIVRPEDIDASNEIESSKIAEARISYGGRGQITDVQQPRYGQQVMDIILPL